MVWWGTVDQCRVLVSLITTLVLVVQPFPVRPCGWLEAMCIEVLCVRMYRGPVCTYV